MLKLSETNELITHISIIMIINAIKQQICGFLLTTIQIYKRIFIVAQINSHRKVRRIIFFVFLFENGGKKLLSFLKLKKKLNECAFLVLIIIMSQSISY